MQLGRVAAGSGVFTLAGVIGSPAPALADNALAATKQSYFRYVPRILVSSWQQYVCALCIVLSPRLHASKHGTYLLQGQRNVAWIYTWGYLHRSESAPSFFSSMYISISSVM